LGLPKWTNHIAFGVNSLEELDTARARINAAGFDVAEIDHHWCKSIYVDDPNGIMVEFCVTTKAFDKDDKQRALDALTSDELADEPPPIIKVFEAG
jgi:catechol-2,3-dioxygenase